jgi:hypothetical protein
VPNLQTEIQATFLPLGALAPWQKKGDGMTESSLEGTTLEPEAGNVSFITKPQRRIKTVSAADIEPEDVEWFWEPYIPKGELTMIGRDPGARKSTLTRFLALAKAKGVSLPGSQPHSPGRVLLLSVEDSPSKTSVPQWIKWGATLEDRGRISIAEEAFTLDKDGIALLGREISGQKPDLVVIDPIVSFIGSDTDMNRQNDVRAILGPLAKLAQQCNVPILIVAHARKTGSGKALHTLMGSVDFSAAVRSVLHVTLDPDDDDVSILSHGKSNLARRGASLRFRVDDQGAFQWLGEDDRTADELTGAPRIPVQRRERERAEDLLTDLLASGPQLQTVIQEHAKANGISERTLERAKKSLGITSRQLKGTAEKSAFCVEPGTTAWVWELPTQVRQAA